MKQVNESQREKYEEIQLKRGEEIKALNKKHEETINTLKTLNYNSNKSLGMKYKKAIKELNEMNLTVEKQKKCLEEFEVLEKNNVEYMAMQNERNVKCIKELEEKYNETILELLDVKRNKDFLRENIFEIVI